MVGSPKELTDRKERKEDGGVEEDRDALGHSLHLKFGQTLEGQRRP
jgi:hypothetical protein